MNTEIYSVLSRVQKNLLGYSNRYRAKLEIGEMATDTVLTVWFTHPKIREVNTQLIVTFDKESQQFKIVGPVTTMSVNLMSTTTPSAIANFNYAVSKYYQGLAKDITCGECTVGEVEYTTSVVSVNTDLGLNHTLCVSATATLPYPQLGYLDEPDVEHRDSYVLRHAILDIMNQYITPNEFDEYHELLKYSTDLVIPSTNTGD